MGYLDELEREWFANKKKCHHVRDPDLERPQSLRGPDLYKELIRLCVLTGDERFMGAVHALGDHGIIDEHGKFTRWNAPDYAVLEEKTNQLTLKMIRLEMKFGKSKKRACAEVAALVGFQSGNL